MLCSAAVTVGGLAGFEDLVDLKMTSDNKLKVKVKAKMKMKRVSGEFE